MCQELSQGFGIQEQWFDEQLIIKSGSFVCVGKRFLNNDAVSAQSLNFMHSGSETLVFFKRTVELLLSDDFKYLTGCSVNSAVSYANTFWPLSSESCLSSGYQKVMDQYSYLDTVSCVSQETYNFGILSQNKLPKFSGLKFSDPTKLHSTGC